METNKKALSEAARTLLNEAHLAAYADCLMHNVSFQPEEYEEVLQIVSAGKAAAESIDPDDATPAGYKRSQEVEGYTL